MRSETTIELSFIRVALLLGLNLLDGVLGGLGLPFRLFPGLLPFLDYFTDLLKLFGDL